MRRRLSDESGIALVMALGVLIVLTVATISLLTYTSSDARTARYQDARSKSYALAEAGINEAMAVLSNPTNNALSGSLLPSTTSTFSSGTATWSGTLNSQTSTWTISSTGTVRNPSGAANVAKALTVHVAVLPDLTQPLNNQAWNYIYDWGTGAPSGCDMSLTNSVNVAAPLYADGNLCLSNSAGISKGPLVVKGRLWFLNGSSGSVGSSGTPLNEAHIGTGCNYHGTIVNPCVNGSSDHVWATILDASPPAISPPAIDFAGWYNSASPGPKSNCDPARSSASSTWPVFENETVNPTRNNSVPAVNLTPTTSYDCVTALGEIGWNASTKVLTISGVIYIDGSAYIQNSSTNSYVGQATLYTSGVFLVNSAKLCAIVASGTCDTADWNPNTRLLVVVSDGNGDGTVQVPVPDGVQLKNSGFFQGGAYATNTIDIGNSFNVDGPLVAKTVSLGQSVSSSFPFINVVPQGTPGNPNTYADPQPPTGYDG